jgi:anti-anti-sigma regulatory factor
MGFELTIAVKRDPTVGKSLGQQPAVVRASFTSIVLTGILDEAAARAVLATISTLAAKSTESILVRMEDVKVDDYVCLARFTEKLMSLRAATIHVQVAVKDPALHTALTALPHSRDWLLRLCDIDPAVPRRAVHLDRPMDGAGPATSPTTLD